MKEFNTDIDNVKKLSRSELSLEASQVRIGGKVKYLLSGMGSVDKILHGTRMGELSVIFGLSGNGKTTFMNQMQISFLNQGEKVWVMSGEFSNRITKKNLYVQMAGKDNLDIEFIPEIDITDVNLKEGVEDKIDSWVKNRLFIHTDKTNLDTNLIKSMEFELHRNGVRVFVIDNLMVIDSMKRNADRFATQIDTIKALNEFAVENDVHVFLIAHAKKPSKGHETMTQYDILGASEIPNTAHNIISVERLYPEDKRHKELMEKRDMSYDSIITCYKNRNYGTNRKIALKFDMDRKLFYDPFDKKELNMRNKWEDEMELWD